MSAQSLLRGSAGRGGLRGGAHPRPIALPSPGGRGRRAHPTPTRLGGPRSRSAQPPHASTATENGAADPERDFRVTVTAQDTVVVPTAQTFDDGCSLDTYMKLPVEHYVDIPLPLGGELRRITRDLFELVVPQVKFFDIWIQPTIELTVRSTREAVHVSAVKCTLNGSKAVTDLRLTEAIKFTVETSFTWCSPTRQEITSTSDIKVLVDPPGYFAFLPTGLLEATGNTVMGLSLRSIQRVFIENLADDYGRWALDEEYREARGGLYAATELDSEPRVQGAVAPAAKES